MTFAPLSHVAPPPMSSMPLPTASSELSDVSHSPGGSLTLETLAGVVDQISRNMDQLGRNMVAMQASLASLLPPPPSLPLPDAPPVSQQARFPYGMPHSGMGVPLHLLQWSASPSPIPSWAMLGSMSAPVYTMATSPTPSVVTPSVAPPAPTSGMFYGGMDGTLFYGGATVSAAPAALGGGSTSATPTIDHGAHGGAPALS